jgi:hypothetical protein
MELELCSYCLSEGPLISLNSIGKLCEKCVEEYLASEQEEKYITRHLEIKKQEAILPPATNKGDTC